MTGNRSGRRAGAHERLLMVCAGIAAGLGAAWPCCAGAAGPRGEQEEREFRSQHSVEGDLARLIARLDSPDFMTRQEASTAIITDGRITIEMVEAALADPDLSPEQRQRLRHVQKQRFESSERAGMGVGFATRLLPHRVVLERTIAPFKATELLEPGDIILSADGIDLHSARAYDTMRMIIISHDPGESVDVVVARGEERLNLSVPLGRYNELGNATPLDPGDVERAWRVRLARTPGPEGEAIATGLTMEDWTQMEEAAESRLRLRNNNAARAGMGLVPPRLLIAGGKPRPPFIDEGEFAKFNMVRDKNELNFEDLQLLRMQEMRLAEARLLTAIDPEPEPLEREIERIRATAEQTRSAIAQINAEAEAGRPVNPEQVKLLEENLRITERVLRALLAEKRSAGE